MNFAPHIKRLSGKCFYQLRQLCSIRRSLNISSTKTLVNAFVAVVSTIATVFLAALVQFISVPFSLSSKRKYDEITSTIRDDLHWLPVWQRLEYKICVLVHKCLHRSAPPYLSSMCANVGTIVGRRHLRSAAHGDLIVRPIKHMDRAVLRCLAHLQFYMELALIII